MLFTMYLKKGVASSSELGASLKPPVSSQNWPFGILVIVFDRDPSPASACHRRCPRITEKTPHQTLLVIAGLGLLIPLIGKWPTLRATEA
jgi:hypothetical protein